jgi:hypothetical protein
MFLRETTQALAVVGDGALVDDVAVVVEHTTMPRDGGILDGAKRSPKGGAAMRGGDIKSRASCRRDQDRW